MITVALFGLVLPTITALLLKPGVCQIWQRGFRYVQQQIFHPSVTVFAFNGRRGLGAIRHIARITRR